MINFLKFKEFIESITFKIDIKEISQVTISKISELLKSRISVFSKKITLESTFTLS